MLGAIIILSIFGLILYWFHLETRKEYKCKEGGYCDTEGEKQDNACPQYGVDAQCSKCGEVKFYDNPNYP